MRFPPLAVPIALMMAGLGWWNAQRFTERGIVPRTKDLSFLPSPILARMLSMGHAGSAAKLRWIDSFSYFELQLDRHDDTLAGSGESGFRRLYDMLIELDPDYELFYEQGAFNTGALIERHDVALGYLLRGLTRLPHSTSLWRQAAVELYVNYQWEKRQPAAMESFLDAWEASETTPNGKRMVWDWKTAMARREYRGLEQIPYWQDQLAAAAPGSASAEYIENTMRDQLARFSVTELTALLDRYVASHGGPPPTLEAAIDRAALEERYPAGPPAWGPIAIADGRIVLRTDPFGFPFAFVDGKVSSAGFERSRAGHKMYAISASLSEVAKRDGRWPRTIEEARAAGVDLQELPPGGSYRLVEHGVVIDWETPPFPPWPLRPQKPAPPGK